MLNRKTILVSFAVLSILIGCSKVEQTTSEGKSEETVNYKEKNNKQIQPIQQEKEKEEVLFPVVGKSQELGFINNRGEVKINFNIGTTVEPEAGEEGAFLTNFEFSEGLAAVSVGSSLTGTWGYIDENGKFLINPVYATAMSFQEEFAAIYIKEGEDYKGGFIDKTGRMIIQPQFSLIRSFSEGLALVNVSDSQKWGFIDKSGKFVINPQFESGNSFSEGLASVGITNNGEEKYGFIDKTGHMVIQPQFAYAGDFKDGLALVKIEEKYGFIDKTGKLVINPQFIDVKDFKEGKAVAATTSFKYGYIDKNGQWVIQPQFAYADSFSEGLASVKVGNEDDATWGYINEKGVFVINPIYKNAIANPFQNGLAKIEYFTYGEESIYDWDYIDKTGKVIWDGEQVIAEIKWEY